MVRQQAKILNPEYSDSDERLYRLKEAIADGEDAEAVIKYADVFISETERTLLDAVKSGKNYEQAALEYRVACKFMDMLKHVAVIGRQKQAIFQEKRRY